MANRFFSICFLTGLLVCVGMCIPSNCTAQDTTQAHIFWQAAHQYRTTKQLDSAIHYFDLAKGIYQKEAEINQDTIIWARMVMASLSKSQLLMAANRMEEAMREITFMVNYAEKDSILFFRSTQLHRSLFGMGKALSMIGNHTEAISYLEKALAIRLTYFSQFPDQIAQIYNALGLAHESLGLSLDALEFFKKAVFYIEQDTLFDNYLKPIIYINIGGQYSALRMLEESENYIIQGINFIKTNPNLDPSSNEGMSTLTSGYNSLSRTYVFKRESEKAKQIVDLSIQVSSSMSPINVKGLATSYVFRGSISFNQKDYHSAIEDIKKGIAYAEGFFKGPHRAISSAYMKLGECYMQINDYKSAEQFFQKSLTIDGMLSDSASLWTSHILEAIGLMNLYRLRNFPVARSSLDKSLAIRKKILGYRSPQVSGSFRALGDLFKATQNLDSAEFYYARSAEISKETYSVPDLRTINIFIHLAVVQALQNRYSQALLQLEKAHEEVREFIKFRTSESAWLDVSAEVDPIYTMYVYAAREAKKENPDSLYEEKAFMFSEYAKSTVLSHKMSASHALSFAGIPSSIIQLESNLKSQLILLDRKILEEKQKVDRKDSVRLMGFQDQLLSAQTSYDSLLNQLERQYPAYYESRHKQSVVSVQEVQQDLAPDQTLIEYLLGDVNLYAFVIRADTFLIVELNRDGQLETNIRHFNEAIYECQSGIDPQCNQDRNNQIIASLGHELYQQLIAPIEEELSERLVIIPDGALGYLPFEALLRSSVDNEPSDQWPFLLQDKKISYAFSATLWKEMKEKQHQVTARKGLLAMAPGFINHSSPEFASARAYRDGYFGPLRYTQTETQNIQSLMSGTLLLDSTATLANFLQQSGNHQIIHLATHGKVMEDPRYSLLAFYGPQDSILMQDTILSGLSALYLSDLYTLQLNADLVVLSACETGVGRLYKGEGIASLARGFTYAGAKSLIPSLWSVNDQSTAFLMEKFYQYLADGQAKDDALRQAKLDLIAEGQAHPFHWAGFVLMGDASPLEDNQSTWLWWLLGISLAILLVFIGYRRINSNT